MMYLIPTVPTAHEDIIGLDRFIGTRRLTNVVHRLLRRVLSEAGKRHIMK
jgi:hypothetical protein